MAPRRQHEQQRPKPRLYLVVPPQADPAAVAATVGAADVAAVLVQARAGAADAEIVARAKAIGALAQPRDVAVLLQGHVPLWKAAGGDGVHFFGLDAFQRGVPGVKPDGIAGVGGLATRHDAMVAGELGADYILFGEPASPQRMPFAAVVERVAWWSEVFEIPCVGWAESPDEAAEIAAVGADFIAVAGFIWNDARGPSAALAQLAVRLDDAEVVK